LSRRQSNPVPSPFSYDLLPLINSGAVDLFENDKLLAQIVGLEWRTARGGRDTIDHD
jgi:hypothetical protein